MKIEFLPDPEVLLALAHQIRASHLAYPLFGLTRKFLEKPEYHRVRITPVAPANAGAAAPQLWRVGADGLVTLDRQFAERVAFDRFSKDFYEETVEQGEPPKGNFSNVARCRLDGTLLGPTNHHSYQAALRGLWESRYARRMPFEAFRHYEIETVNDPAEVERWKEQSRTSKTWVVKGSEPTLALRSAEEVRRHFEQNHLPQIVQAVPDAEFAASADREHGPDTPLARAIRFEGEHEARHPLNLVQFVRTGLQRAGLQVFKHKKKVVYVSAIRPAPFRADAGSPVSTNIQAILDAIATKPGLSRAELALAIIGAPPPAAEPPVAEASVTPDTTSVDDAPPAEALSTGDTVSDMTPAAVASESVPTGETASATESPAPTAAIDEAPPAAEASPIAEEDPATAPAETSTVEAPASLVEDAAPAAPLSPAEEIYAKAKGALVADLRWLLLSGHVIGFFDGTFDLPPTAKPPSPAVPGTPAAPVASESPAPAAEGGESVDATEGPASEETVALDQETTPQAPETPPAPVEDPSSALNVPIEGTEAKTEPHPEPSHDRPAEGGAEPSRHA